MKEKLHNVLLTVAITIITAVLMAVSLLAAPKDNKYAVKADSVELEYTEGIECGDDTFTFSMELSDENGSLLGYAYTHTSLTRELTAYLSPVSLEDIKIWIDWSNAYLPSMTDEWLLAVTNGSPTEADLHADTYVKLNKSTVKHGEPFTVTCVKPFFKAIRLYCQTSDAVRKYITLSFKGTTGCTAIVNRNSIWDSYYDWDYETETLNNIVELPEDLGFSVFLCAAADSHPYLKSGWITGKGINWFRPYLALGKDTGATVIQEWDLPYNQVVNTTLDINALSLALSGVRYCDMSEAERELWKAEHASVDTYIVLEFGVVGLNCRTWEKVTFNLSQIPTGDGVNYSPVSE